MSKIVYFCPSCGAAFEDKPEIKTLSNPHPHNVCLCGTVVNPCDCIVKQMSYQEWSGIPKIRLHPNWLD